MGGQPPNSGMFAALVRLFLFSSARRTAFEIGEAGERAVALQLHASGYRVHRDTQGPGATDIVAAGNGRSLLVQVKAAQSPTPRAARPPRKLVASMCVPPASARSRGRRGCN